MNISRKINQIVLWTLILLCILSVLGLLNFGHGLGNIVYIIPIILLTVLHITLTIIARKKDKNSYYFPMAIIFTIISIGIFYQGTYGRGGEFSWNGEILFLKDVETESTKTTKKLATQKVFVILILITTK